MPAEPFRKEATGPDEPTEANPTGTVTEEADQPSPYREELTSPVPVKPEPSEMEGHRSAEKHAPLVLNEATSSTVGPHGVLGGPSGLPSSGTHERPSLPDAAVTRAAPGLGAHGDTVNTGDEAITLEAQIVRPSVSPWRTWRTGPETTCA